MKKTIGNSSDYMVTTVSNERELTSLSPIAHIEMIKNHFLAIIASIEMIRYVYSSRYKIAQLFLYRIVTVKTIILRISAEKTPSAIVELTTMAVDQHAWSLTGCKVQSYGLVSFRLFQIESTLTQSLGIVTIARQRSYPSLLKWEPVLTALLRKILYKS